MSEFADFLAGVRDDLAAMIRDPLDGFGAEVTDFGYDLTSDTAELVFEINGIRVELQIRKLP